MTDTKEKIGDMSSRALPSDVDWDVIWKRDAGNFLAGGPSTRTRIRLALWMLKKYSKENGSLLDVGCGSGLLLGLAAAKRHYAKIAGVDVASAALDLARASYPSFSFYELDVQKQRLPEMFDTIISLATVDIIEDDKAAMRNMAAMLAPRGHLMISVYGGATACGILRIWPVPQNFGLYINFPGGGLFTIGIIKCLSGIPWEWIKRVKKAFGSGLLRPSHTDSSFLMICLHGAARGGSYSQCLKSHERGHKCKIC